ncbi:MAG TPA: transaldolase family protein [Candidatus Limnocylindrales bacterium]|nr:transaldolase family protein [Candidatus Limnocylindrales bacterium]
MRILVDSADLAAIRDALETGFVAGATTNPSLLRRAGVSAVAVPDLARAILDAGAGELHLQATAADVAGLVDEGRRLAALDPARVRIKLVATPDGYRAAARLAVEGIPVTLTGVYTVRQALVADSVGARSIAVYLGRLRDMGEDPMALVGSMQALFDTQASAAEILAASIREPDELVELALIGVASATIAPPVLHRMLDSDATAAAAATFADDAEAIAR